jgi:hypothetical protein
VTGVAGKAGALVGRFSIRFATAGRRLIRFLSRLNQNGAPKVSKPAVARTPNRCGQNCRTREKNPLDYCGSSQRVRRPAGTNIKPVFSMSSFKMLTVFCRDCRNASAPLAWSSSYSVSQAAVSSGLTDFSLSCALREPHDRPLLSRSPRVTSVRFIVTRSRVLRILKVPPMPAATGDGQAPRPQEVSISYSRKDKEFMRRLDESLFKSRGCEAGSPFGNPDDHHQR